MMNLNLNSKISVCNEKHSFCLISKLDIITDIGEDLLKLIGYSADEIIAKETTEVFFSLLRMPKNLLEQVNLKGTFDCYLFTKTLDAIGVTVSVLQETNTNNMIYSIIEIPECRIDDKLIFVEQLFMENTVGLAIFSAPDLIFLKSNKKYLDFMEPQFNLIENCIGKSLYECIPGFVGSNSEMLFDNVIKTGKSDYYNEFKYDHFTRGVTYWDGSVVPLYISGKVGFIIQLATEITEKVLNRKRIEKQSEKIKQQNDQLNAIIENMSDALLIFDKNGKYTILNKSAREKFIPIFKNISYIGDGYKHTKFYDNDGCIILPENHPARKVLSGERLTDYKISIKSSDDIVFYVEINATPIYDNAGNFIAGLLCIRDVTEKNKTEYELKNQKELLETIIENIPDPFALNDINGNLVKMNAAGRKLYPQQVAIKSTDVGLIEFKLFDIVGKEIHTNNLPTYRALRGETVRNEIMIIKREDRDQITEINAIPIYDKDNNLVSAATFHRDITETVQNQRLIKIQQEQMLQTEKHKYELLEKSVEMKDEFLSLISHEFKTPITVINSAIQAMELICKAELTDKAKEYLNMIRQNSFRQLRLVNNLLDITRVSAGHIKLNIKNYDIVFITESVVKSICLYTEQKGVSLLFSTKFAKKIIGFDEEKYERILLNLLSNAIKFTPKGKCIFVTITSQKGFVCIKVKDKGIGIPKDKQELIFERFGQVDSSLSRHAEGSGIGLSLVKMYVEALGGSITVSSKVGIGSVFTILLPNTKVQESKTENTSQEDLINRIVQATATQFSDIYLTQRDEK